MTLSRRALFIATAAAASTAYASKADEKSVDAARVAVLQVLAAHAVPAFSVAVVRGKEIVWAEAFGKADLELDVTATPLHRFRLGSVSKVVVATTFQRRRLAVWSRGS